MRSLVLSLIALGAALLAAPACEAQAPEPIRAVPGFQLPPCGHLECAGHAVCCSASRHRLVSANYSPPVRPAAQPAQGWGRPVPATPAVHTPAASTRPSATTDTDRLGRVVSVLEAHQNRIEAVEGRVTQLEAWRHEVDAKLDRLLQQNGYPSSPLTAPVPYGAPVHLVAAPVAAPRPLPGQSGYQPLPSTLPLDRAAYLRAQGLLPSAAPVSP